MPLTRTFTGRLVDPLNLKVEDIVLEDIAHALSMKCRFNGHTKKFYSVAEHSCRVMWAASVSAGQRLTPVQRFHLLFHDAAEAYLPDFAAPIKHLAAFRVGGMSGFSPAACVEGDVEHVIRKKWSVPDPGQFHHTVKHWDNVLVAAEARDLMGVEPGTWADYPSPYGAGVIVPDMTPEASELAFLAEARSVIAAL